MLAKVVEDTSTRSPREALVEGKRRPRTTVERTQVVHKDTTEALNKARAQLCWPSGLAHNALEPISTRNPREELVEISTVASNDG